MNVEYGLPHGNLSLNYRRETLKGLSNIGMGRVWLEMILLPFSCALVGRYFGGDICAS